jgi:hypothetical protein
VKRILELRTEDMKLNILKMYSPEIMIKHALIVDYINRCPEMAMDVQVISVHGKSVEEKSLLQKSLDLK